MKQMFSLLCLCTLVYSTQASVSIANSTTSSSPTGTRSVPVGTSTTSSSGNSTGLAGVTGVESNVTAFAHLWKWVDCSPAQKTAVLQGLEEAHDILDTEGVWYLTLDKHFNDYAAVEFLGDPRAVYASRQNIKDQYQRAYNYQQHWYHWWDTQVFCRPDDVGYCAQEPGYIAVDNNYNNKGVGLAFCQRYFSLGSLKSIYNQASRSQGLEKWDLSKYENRARAWITTMMRINSIGKWPVKKNGLVPVTTTYPGETSEQWVASCSQCKYLSKIGFLTDTEARIKTVVNPDNWSWFALAQYVTYRLKDYPSLPQVPDSLQPLAGFTVSGATGGGFDDLTDPDYTNVTLPY